MARMLPTLRQFSDNYVLKISKWDKDNVKAKLQILTSINHIDREIIANIETAKS